MLCFLFKVRGFSFSSSTGTFAAAICLVFGPTQIESIHCLCVCLCTVLIELLPKIYGKNGLKIKLTNRCILLRGGEARPDGFKKNIKHLVSYRILKE
jgi:hypothetical protein